MAFVNDLVLVLQSILLPASYALSPDFLIVKETLRFQFNILEMYLYRQYNIWYQIVIPVILALPYEPYYIQLDLVHLSGSFSLTPTYHKATCWKADMLLYVKQPPLAERKGIYHAKEIFLNQFFSPFNLASSG